MLFYGEFWNTINCIFCDISTIRKKIYKSDNTELFKIAYDILFKKHSKNRNFKYLFIDSTIVQMNNTFLHNISCNILHFFST